jgi:predicted acyltransferase
MGMQAAGIWQGGKAKENARKLMKDSHIPPQISESRLAAIDQFRGFAILLMVLADYLSHIESVPIWLKHARFGAGLTVVDLIAPMFIFAMALGYRPSMQRRILQQGRRKTALHFIRRYLALIGIGALTPLGYSWGLFQTIGGAGLLSLLVIWLPGLARVIIGAVGLAAYQLLLDTVWMARTPSTPWCIMEGVISWGMMLILASALADLYHDRPRRWRPYLLGSLASLALGIALSNWIDVSLYYVSASYVLISLGASALLFAGFHALTDRLSLPLLIAWGKNPLLLYILHYWIWVFAFLGPRASTWHLKAPLWLIALQAAGFIGLLSLIAWFLDRRGWILSL